MKNVFWKNLTQIRERPSQTGMPFCGQDAVARCAVPGILRQTKILNRLLASFVGAVLAIGLFMPFLPYALAESMQIPAQESNAMCSFTDVTILQNMVYAWESYSEKLYAVNPVDETCLTYQFAGSDTKTVPLSLFVNNQTLCMIAARIETASPVYLDAGVYRLELSTDGVAIGSLLYELDLSFAVEESEVGLRLPEIDSLAVSDTQLFLELQKADGQSEILSYFWGDRTCHKLPLNGSKEIVAANTKLLMFLSDDATIQTYDLESNTLQTFVELPASVDCCAYDAEAAALYILDNGLYKMTRPVASDRTLVANIPQSGSFRVACNGSIVAAMSTERIYVAAINEQGVEQQVLTVYGGLDYSALQAYMAQNPSVSIEFISMTDANDVMANVLAHNPQPDIYCFFSLDSPYFPSMLSRGYLSEITDAASVEFVNMVCSGIRGECFDAEGKLRAVPVSAILGNRLAVNKALWESLNLGELPQTWNALFDFLDQWCADGRSDVTLLPYSDAQETREMIGYILRSDYDNYRHSFERKPGYSTEIYRQLLHRLFDIDFERLNYNPGSGDTLMSDMYIPSASRNVFTDSSQEMLKLSVDGTVAPQILATTYFLCVNAASPNQETAMDFVRFFAENVSSENRALLCPSFNDTVLSSEFEDVQASYREALAMLEAQLAACNTPAEQTEIQYRLDDLIRNNEDYLQNGAYTISQETLDRYHRDTEGGLVVNYGEGVLDSETLESLTQKHRQFLAGVLSVEQYTEALDQIVYMQELENSST